MIELTRKLADLEYSLSREWLETNGLGGFASSTVIGLNTRRYHGLLTAATRPPVGRIVMLSKLEETLVIDGNRYELSANQYPGVIHPQGFLHQTGFRLDPFPIFTYQIGDLRLQKSIFMVHGQNTAVVHYELESGKSHSAALKLEIRPLIAFRDYHSTTHANEAINSKVETVDGIASIRPYADLPPLYFAHDYAELQSVGDWYRNFQYAVEQERGLDAAEDLFNPFVLTFDLNRYSRARILASTGPRDIRNADHYRDSEITRRKEIIGTAHPGNTLVETLVAAADQFIVDRGNQKSVIAGYPWFGDWGRDTMIALPGLTLTTGRPDIARSILAEFAKYVDQGMLPNRFPDAGESPEYNTVDATLWFFESIRSLLAQTHDYDFVWTKLYDRLKDIIAWHVHGTRYGIHVDTDGLLYSGEPGVQLTWMDAKVGDWVVTPRRGKAVEIQALWYNALRVMEHLAHKFEDKKPEKNYAVLAKKARQSFGKVFWNEADDCLYDVINGDERDSSIRPNQILAISLAHPVVPKQKAQRILAVVQKELLTPRGLRTLSPRDSKYCGRYEGEPQSRDGSYHQGTVWPWLIGPYLTAYTKTFGEEAGRKIGAEWLEAFEPHLYEACLGQVSEIFDGDAPHKPRGCVAQAWSVAELVRVAVEEVGQPLATSQVAGR